MNHTRTRGLRTAAIAVAAITAVMGAPTATAAGTHKGGSGPAGSQAPQVVAGGLDNPRHLSFTRSGDLLIAEAGEGGAGPCMAGPEGGEVCFGTSGADTLLTHRGRQYRVLQGLPSLADKGTGASAIGPADVAGGRRQLTVLIGLGANPAARSGLPRSARTLGTLVRTNGRGGLKVIADLAAWEGANNPVEGPDSNPSGLAELGGGRFAIADAGGNTALSVGKRGAIKLVAALQNRLVDFNGAPIPVQAVPTSVATRGWDGALYVSQLTGGPFVKGVANIYRVDPRNGKVSVYATALTNVTDLAFNGRTLYAVQIATEGLLNGPIGSVVKVKPGGTVPADHTAVASGLFAPYGIAIKGGSAYVTINSIAKDTGQVLKIRL